VLSGPKRTEVSSKLFALTAHGAGKEATMGHSPNAPSAIPVMWRLHYEATEVTSLSLKSDPGSDTLVIEENPRAPFRCQTSRTGVSHAHQRAGRALGTHQLAHQSPVLEGVVPETRSPTPSRSKRSHGWLPSEPQVEAMTDLPGAVLYCRVSLLRR